MGSPGSRANSSASPTSSSASCGVASPWACCCPCRSSWQAWASSFTRCAIPPSRRPMTPLEHEIRAAIAARGPMSVARYMDLCLTHPTHGYYMTRDPLGARGDFITAPEVSQMFGELVGLWAAAVWKTFPADARHSVNLVELGPGRGTLMADVLRATKIVPDFHAAIRVHLVEASPTLRQRQLEKLTDCGVTVQWHDDVMDVPWGPTLILANEFFDARSE